MTDMTRSEMAENLRHTTAPSLATITNLAIARERREQERSAAREAAKRRHPSNLGRC